MHILRRSMRFLLQGTSPYRRLTLPYLITAIEKSLFEILCRFGRYVRLVRLPGIHHDANAHLVIEGGIMAHRCWDILVPIVTS